MQINLLKKQGGLRLSAALSTLILIACGAANAQPVNDNCDAATVLPGSAPNPPTIAFVDTTDATLDPADPLLSCNIIGDGDNTVWFEWTPDASGEVNISTFISATDDGTGELDTAHGMFVGECGALIEVACVDIGLNDELITEVEAGTTYRIKVGEFADGLSQPETDGGIVSLSIRPAPSFPEQFTLESSRHGVSPNMRDIVGTPAAPVSAGGAGNIADSMTEIPNVMAEEVMKTQPAGLRGPSRGSKVSGKKGPMQGAANLEQIFEGGENDDNAFILQTLIAPPDTVGDVGRKYYVQMYNLLTEIFDKNGNTVLGPFPTNAFFTGLGGQCEFTNSGDPIVLYDEQKKRWFVSQFAAGFPQDGLCIAVSKTSDPTGAYYQYEFDFTGIGFPDYPKFGFASKSISVMANMFSPFSGTGLGVIDKKEAMKSGPATMIFFILGPTEFGFIPGDNDGPKFNNFKPTFFTNNFFSGDEIDVWEIKPNFRRPDRSRLTEVASVEVSPFDTDLCDAFREECIDQPGSGTEDIPRLEAISDRMMHRAQILNYGGQLRAMLSHTVDVDGDGTAGVRWYEMKKRGGQNWELKEENTFSPDGDHRWMGSVAMTRDGKTCLGYSISSQDTFPSIGLTGRTGNQSFMNVPEIVAFDGNAAGNVQRQTARWGDYSSMSVDPVDGSCWYTTEYAKPNSFFGEVFGWGTKVMQFKVGN